MARKPKVFIGVGHGGSDPGAVANGIKEKNAVLVMAKACNDELIRHGAEVMMSRTSDTTEGLNQRIKECNAFKPDHAVDFHLNAGGGDGFEAYHYSKGGESKALANAIAIEVKNAGQNLRKGDSGKADGLKTKLNAQGKDYFGFIRETAAPAIIAEFAFLDNKEDVKIVDTVAEQKAMGVAAAKGILKRHGIKWQPKATYDVTVAGLSKEKAEDLVEKLKKDGYSVSMKKK